jgi:hypothetical protein
MSTGCAITKKAVPGTGSLCEEEFNEEFAGWACSRGYCEPAEWDEI